MKMEPRSGLSNPTSVLRKTDLPVPDGPSMTLISPGGRVSVTSPQMTCLPNDFVRPSTATSTPTPAPSLTAACAEGRHARRPDQLWRYNDQLRHRLPAG